MFGRGYMARLDRLTRAADGTLTGDDIKVAFDALERGEEPPANLPRRAVEYARHVHALLTSLEWPFEGPRPEGLPDLTLRSIYLPEMNRGDEDL